MRASSPGFRRGSRALIVSLSLSGPFGLAGCDKAEPAPQKLERVSPFERGAIKRKPADPNNPLRNPAREAPRGRDGEQLPAAEIDAALAKAEEQAAVSNKVGQRNALRMCANKTPASARCDGEMGLAQIESRNRKAAAVYYLAEAARNDDPEASAALYRRVGEALRGHGRHEDAVAALRLAVARDPSADNLFALGQTLSLRPEGLVEGIDHIAAARVLDDEIEWLYEEAVLNGQLPVRERAELAIARFRLYVERASGLPPEKIPSPIEGVEARIKELEGFVKQYPTQVEYDKAKAKAKAKAEAEAAAAAQAGAEADAGVAPASPP